MHRIRERCENGRQMWPCYAFLWNFVCVVGKCARVFVYLILFFFIRKYQTSHLIVHLKSSVIVVLINEAVVRVFLIRFIDSFQVFFLHKEMPNWINWFDQKYVFFLSFGAFAAWCKSVKLILFRFFLVCFQVSTYKQIGCRSGTGVEGKIAFN